ANRHVRIGAPILGHESADVARKDPVEAGISAWNEENPSSETLRRVPDRGHSRRHAFPRNKVWLAWRDVKCEHVAGRRDNRRKNKITRQRVTFSATRNTLPQYLAHRTALAIERADRVVIQEGTVVRRKTMLLSQLPDQRQRVAQASSEHELRVFAALNPGLDELDQAQHVDVQLVFLEQLLDAAQLLD